MPRIPRLHVVTDDALLARDDFPSLAESIMDAGRHRMALHVRGPHSTGRAVYEIVAGLGHVAEAAGTVLSVNDRVDVALALGARAVHLGTRSLAPAHVRRLVGPDRVVGCSTHSVEEVSRMGDAAVDYVFFGNVFATPSHPDREGSGPAALRQAVEAGRGLPVVAIGGVDVRRAAVVRQEGAHGVAVLRGVWEARSPTDAVSDYISALGG